MEDEKKEAGMGGPEDETTRQILDEIEEESKAKAAEGKKSSDEDKDDDADDDEKEEDEDIDDDESEDDEGEEEDDETRPGAKMVPAYKIKIAEKRLEKKLRDEFDAKLKDLSEKPKGDRDEGSDEVKAIVKEFGLHEELGPKFIEAIAGVIARKGGIDKDIREKIQKFETIHQDEVERAGFEKEFSTNEKLIRKIYPDIDTKGILKVKDKLHDLAYDKKYAHYRLEDVIRLNRKSLYQTKGAGGESSRGGTSKGEFSVDLSQPDKIPWNELTPEQFQKVSDELGKRSTGRLTVVRDGKIINKK